MIEGFEKYTHDLTELELSLVPYFIKGLLSRRSKHKAVTSSEIIKAYRTKRIPMDGARVRKIINHIRMTEDGFVIVASSKGYWVTTDPTEIEQQIESLTHRANSQLAVAKKMRDFILTQKN